MTIFSIFVKKVESSVFRQLWCKIIKGFVDAQRNIYDANNFNEEFLFNYKPERFHVTVDLPANAATDTDVLDPYANLPEDIE